jgi:hypothetical protein
MYNHLLFISLLTKLSGRRSAHGWNYTAQKEFLSEESDSPDKGSSRL